jgi:hypothetical protein
MVIDWQCGAQPQGSRDSARTLYCVAALHCDIYSSAVRGHWQYLHGNCTSLRQYVLCRRSYGRGAAQCSAVQCSTVWPREAPALRIRAPPL